MTLFPFSNPFDLEASPGRKGTHTAFLPSCFSHLEASQPPRSGKLSGSCHTMGESFTIQISSNLVNQLADDGGKLKKKTKRSKTRIPREPQQSQTKLHQKQISGDSETPEGTAPPVGWPVQPPLFLPVSRPPQSANVELDAIHSAVQESERVLERLQKQEEVMVQEVTQRAKDLHDKEFKLPCQKPPPCLLEKDACHVCYKEHVKDPLKCADLVKNYTDCIRRDIQQVSSADK